MFSPYAIHRSTANSFIDFHVDFGGTSVWYHVLRGNKVFWLVPPTDSNLLKYEKWQQESAKKTEFFGSLAEGCCRLEVPAGATLFLPAGWVHAVFTPRDSVVFSGSFLHSFNIEHQLKVNFIEDSLNVAEKHRFPFFTEMLW
jgi:F-box/leucine-rich repeat protein 10/11